MLHNNPLFLKACEVLKTKGFYTSREELLQSLDSPLLFGSDVDAIETALDWAAQFHSTRKNVQVGEITLEGDETPQPLMVDLQAHEGTVLILNISPAFKFCNALIYTKHDEKELVNNVAAFIQEKGK